MSGNFPGCWLEIRVFVQNQNGPHPTKWDRSGVIVECRDYDQYLVKLDGTGQLTLRNRRFLRKYTLPSPLMHSTNKMVEAGLPFVKNNVGKDPNSSIVCEPFQETLQLEKTQTFTPSIEQNENLNRISSPERSKTTVPQLSIGKSKPDILPPTELEPPSRLLPEAMHIPVVDNVPHMPSVIGDEVAECVPVVSKPTSQASTKKVYT